MATPVSGNSDPQEMHIRREALIPEAKECQIHSSWVPITPVKPIEPKLQPICTGGQRNHPKWLPEEFSSRLEQEIRAHGQVTCGDSTNYNDINRDFDNWETTLAENSGGSGRIRISSDYSVHPERFKNVPFGHLVALADAAATTPYSATATGQGYANAVIFNSHFEGNQLETSATNCLLGNRGSPFGSNMWSSCSVAPDTPLYGNTTSRSTTDLNSQPTALSEAFSSSNISSQFSPITPDQSAKTEYKQAYHVDSLNVDDRTIHARDNQGNEVATTRVVVEEHHHDKDQQQLPKDLPGAAVSTQLDEYHDPDNGGNSSIELDRAQQKPRRRKHRPKVVIEGKPKRTRKPATPKTATPRENPTGKRKYVRKNVLNKTGCTPTAEVINGSADTKKTLHTAKSSRRKLNFDFLSRGREESSSCRSQAIDNAESQAQNFHTRVESESTVQLGQGMDGVVEKAQVGFAYDSMNKEFEDYISMHERQAPSTASPTKTDQLHEKVKVDAQKERTRGKCNIVFSDETHGRQGSTMQIMMNTDPQSLRTPNNSKCSSSRACFTEEAARGLKRVYSCTIAETEPTSCRNVMGGHYNSMHEYQERFPAIVYNDITCGIHFPAIPHKKRAEKGHSSNPTTSMLSIPSAAENSVRQTTMCPLNHGHASPWAIQSNCRFSAAQFNPPSSTISNTVSVMDAQGIQQPCKGELALDHQGRMTNKRSRGPTQARNFTSPMYGDMQVYRYNCMEALFPSTPAAMTTKKRRKKNTSTDSLTTGATQMKTPTIDAVVEYLDWLDINLESNQVRYLEQNPYSYRYEEQNALVLYSRDGTIVPFQGSFDPVRKRRPRPKVDLDEETNRVWRLLLENINSEGIDGTDEEKAKWWEEERRVFQGRANSFIARMHLVQGDRRFSPWKGSVVDSVVGVFLTQNVSDHLSSSAYMSLAARFPLNSKGKDMPCFEESIMVNEPEACILDTEDTIRWPGDKSNQPSCSRSSMVLHDMDCNVVNVNGNELLGSSSYGVKSTETSKWASSYVPGNNQEIFQKPTDKARSQLTEAVACFMGDKREVDDALSSQNSCGSSQNSVDSSTAQTSKITGSFLQDNLEADPATKPNTNNPVGSSFVNLLERQGTLPELYYHKVGNTSSNNRNGCTYMEGAECDGQKRKDKSDHSKTFFDPIISSESYHPQMTPDSGGLEDESFEMSGEENLFSDVPKKSEENCASDLSGITVENVSPVMCQTVAIDSSHEGPKSTGETNHASSSLQGEVNKIFESQNMPVRNSNDHIQSRTQEHTCRIQQVFKVQRFSRETLDVTESTSIKGTNITEHQAVGSSLKDHGHLLGKEINGSGFDASKVTKGRIGKQEEVDWDGLRLKAQAKGKRERTANTNDSLDWEAVRCADVSEIADTIRERGMNNMLAERIKAFLNRLVTEHGSIDLEWLRDVPPDKAKEFLLSVRGLGLKSVECVRLLTLHHLAFPVDTNVGRIAVRLGWVPLQPLPESLQLHLLELYPVLESIQRYLWPRLCKLDQRILYELHYQMITFGKVFCTKSKPNCNACPMRGECRHFASAFASARLALPGPEEKSIVSAGENKATNQIPVEVIKRLQLPLPQGNQQQHPQCQTNNGEPIIEMSATIEPIVEVPATPEPIIEVPATPEPIVEVPASPGSEQPQVPENDIEDMIHEDLEDIPTIRLNIEELTQNLQNYMQQNMELQEDAMSRALVALTPEAASLPMPKLKNVSRLRTEHRVYELPDSHPLLDRMEKREPDDPCSYLLAIWTPGETADSIQPPETRCSSQECGKLCNEKTCFSCNSFREANSQTVRGTLLIPCRTAMRGRFPLNGTYFQVNEVFADHDSSIKPVDVPRSWIWNLPRRTVYFGTSIPAIFKGLSTEHIQYCFWRGFVCVRGFDQKTRAPRPLLARLHFPASKLPKTKGNTDDKQE